MMNRIVISLLFMISSIFAQDIFDEFDEFIEPATTIGGYGELHYNWSKADGDDESIKKLDFHRFVLFLSHSWSKYWSFKSEIELEHNVVGNGKGEIELEQAYINYHHSRTFGFQVGVILPSIGFINESHEPPLFLSVERPDYATNIIPTTWFGNGAALYGKFTDFDYKLTIMEGLDGTGFFNNDSIRSMRNDGIRGGRQKGFEANAGELLYNARLDFTVIHGLVIGGSYTFNNAFLAVDTTIATTIFEAHVKYIHHNFHSVFEYGNISLDGGDAGYDIKKANGFYIDFGYDIASRFGYDGHIIPWFRFTDYNTAASVAGGGDAEKANHYTKWLVGLTIKPIDPIVFKIDFGAKTRELDDERTILLNLGAGYMF